MMKYLIKKPVFLVVISFLAALAAFCLLLYANVGFLNWSGYFDKHDVYKDSIVLFFHEECLYCTKVDNYLANNNVQKKVEFTRLNVLQSDYNRSELQDKAQICGLEIESIGVPFLWDGPNKKCVVGYVDIIEFFQKKLRKP